MRDITIDGGIQAGGDVKFIDQSQPKLLAQCSSEELIHEQSHRSQLLRGERSRRWSVFLQFCFFAAGLMLFAIAWAHLNGSTDLVSLFSGAAGVLLGVANLKAMEHPSQFEVRQLGALSEIQMLLRERQVR